MTEVQAQAQLNVNGVVTVAGVIRLYGYDMLKVFTKAYDAYLTIGSSIPENATTVAPPSTIGGTSPIFEKKTNTWTEITDHRGEIVYNKKTQAKYVIDYLGDYRSDVTPYAPSSVYDTWNEQTGGWDKDSDITVQDKAASDLKTVKSELARAEQMISIMDDKLEIQYFDPNETEEMVKANLTVWKRYRIECTQYISGVLKTIPLAPDSAEYAANQQAIADAAAAKAAREAEEAAQSTDADSTSKTTDETSTTTTKSTKKSS